MSLARTFFVSGICLLSKIREIMLRVWLFGTGWTIRNGLTWKATGSLKKKTSSYLSSTICVWNLRFDLSVSNDAVSPICVARQTDDSMFSLMKYSFSGGVSSRWFIGHRQRIRSKSNAPPKPAGPVSRSRRFARYTSSIQTETKQSVPGDGCRWLGVWWLKPP